MATPTTPVAPLTAHLTPHVTPQPPTSAVPHIKAEDINLSRAQVPWRPEIWTRIDRAVAHEVHRTRKATRFMPQLRVGHHVTNVEQDVVLQNLNPGSPPFVPPRAVIAGGAAVPPTLNVYEGANLSVIELSIRWALTHAQVKKENERHQEMHGAPGTHPEHPEHSGPPEHSVPPEHHPHSGHLEHHHPSSTAVLLARRATNTLCLGVDALAWLGSNAFPAPGVGGAPPIPGIPLFGSRTVLFNGVPADTGLTCIGGPNTPLEVLTVNPANAVAAGGPAVTALYSTQTVAAISRAVTDLGASGYGGPYVAVLPPYFFAESFFPLGNTLQRPADLIRPLLDAGYYDSVVLPGVPNPQTPNPGGNPLGLPNLTNPNAQGVGFVASLGGNVVEFVNGLDPVAAFSQIDGDGNYILQLKTRVATKISDANGIVRLEFN